VKNTLWLFSILLLFVSRALPQTQSVPADIVAKLRRQGEVTYVHTQIPHDEEYAAAMLSNGPAVPTMMSARGGQFGLPLGVLLLTRPYGAQLEPNDASAATANKISAPNCVVTVKEVWCAMPNGNIVPGVLLAKKPAAQTPGFEVQVYDYAALEPSILQKFARSTQEILSGTGISINVVLCERTTAGSCGNPDNREKLLLRVLPGSAKKMNNALYSPLGQSFADHRGGKYASVYLESIKDQASETNIPWLTVLDYAVVHEIGHLLLGDQAHTPRGIMKERWDVNDYVDMAQGRFQFSDEQIRQLRSRYASSTQVEVTSMEARH